ncbi:MAG TPA: IS3 family transposase [Thermodesulfobacteriota bacterium]|nr:IS3 family transposase [Thermodesulfobacteriota bacterium]
MAREYIGEGNKVSKVLSAVDMSRSTYYYRANEGRKGRKPDRYVMHSSGGLFPEQRVIEEIKDLLSKEFVNYGYIKVSRYLKDLGYIINKKRVYRIMKENRLLLKMRIRSLGKREFVKEIRMSAERPYEKLQMDIKYVYVQGERKNVYLLSVMDIFSRKVLGYRVSGSMRQGAVIGLMDEVILKTAFPKEVTIRTDNGSQFIAHKVRDYLKGINIEQEFTHVSSPRENGYIESLHSILEEEVIEKFEFESLEHLRCILDRYFRFYNGERIHSGIGYKSPDRFLREYQNGEEKLAEYG